jgi:hypothetical protein
MGGLDSTTVRILFGSVVKGAVRDDPSRRAKLRKQLHRGNAAQKFFFRRPRIKKIFWVAPWRACEASSGVSAAILLFSFFHS